MRTPAATQVAPEHRLRHAVAGAERVPDDGLAAAVGHALRPVVVVEFAPAAGDGASPQAEEATGVMWFPSELLARLGVAPAQCAVIGVRGESMEPTLPDGCSILVDRGNRGRRSGGVYVLRTDALVLAHALIAEAVWAGDEDSEAQTGGDERRLSADVEFDRPTAPRPAPVWICPRTSTV